MKKIIFLGVALSLCTGTFVFGQAAGNYIYNKSNRFQKQEFAPRFSDENFEGDYSNRDRQHARGQYKNAGNVWFVNDNVMEFEANALYNAKATDYLAIFNITQLGETAREADSIVNGRVQRMLAELNDLGLSEDDMVSDVVSLLPIYEYEVTKKIFSKTYNEVPKGFELQKNLHIHYKEAAQLDKIMSAAAKNEIYDLVKVDYYVEESAAVYDSLREACVAFLKEKVKDYEALGIEFDTLYRVIAEDSRVSFPEDRYKPYQSFASAALEQVDQVRKRGRQVTKIRKPKTMFYDKIPYYNFDVVINPIVVEPVIQFQYYTRLKFIVKTPPKKIENHYKLIFPDGQIKTLEVK